nr:hypothetical protein [Tanacetum cinerariifolium]
TMANINIHANDAPAEQAPAVASPTRTDDQILPSSKWVPIGKNNCVLDVQKSQRNPIFPIVVDALDITPTNDNNPYVAPPSSDIDIKYVNTLGYLSTPRNMSAMSVNALYQPWRAILSMINMCLIEFVQSIQTFLNDKNLTMASRENKKTTHLLISTVRFVGNEEEGGAIESPKATKITKSKAAKATKPAAKRSKGGLVGKIRKPRSPLKLVDKPSAEDVLVEEPAYNEEEASLQRALELSLKEQAERTQRPARPVVIREPDSGRIQPLLDVQGKGKEKRRTSMPTEASGHAESPSLDAELALTDNKTESDNLMSKIDAGDQDEGQAGLDPGDLDKGQAGPNPSVQDEGQVGSNPDQFFMEKQQEEEPGKTNAKAEVQSMVSVPIHQDTSSVPLMTTPVIDLTTTADLILVKRIDELEQHMANLLQHNLALEERLDKHGSWIPHQVSKAVDEIVTDAVDWAMQAPLRARFSDLSAKSLERDYSNQLLSDLEKARQKKRKRRDLPRTPFGSPPSHPPPLRPSVSVSGALGTSVASGFSQFPLPPPPLSTGTSGSAQQQGSEAPSSSKSAALATQSLAWTTFDTRYESPGVSRTQELSPTDSLIQDDSILNEQVHFLMMKTPRMITYQKLIREKTSGNHYSKRKDQRILNCLDHSFFQCIRR